VDELVTCFNISYVNTQKHVKLFHNYKKGEKIKVHLVQCLTQDDYIIKKKKGGG